MRDAPIVPSSFELEPIGDAALDGRFHLVFGETYFAVARAADGVWVHSSGIPVDFLPTHYHVAAKATEGSHGQG